MEYKTYRAKTFQEARLKMLLDAGNRAYIVSHKKIKEGGFLGLFAKPMIEITAGIMKFHQKRKNLPISHPISHSRNQKQPYSSSYPERLQERWQERQEERQQERHSEQSLETRAVQDIRIASSHSDGDISMMRKELDEMKGLMSRLLTQKGSKEESEQTESSRQDWELNQNLLRMLLKEEDFEEDFIADLLSLSGVQMILRKEKDLEAMKRYLRKQVYQLVEMGSGVEIQATGQNILFLVGPTGVGKTTTLAKLGAYFGVFQKKKVRFLSIDTYRVGAIQQLKLYADIMEIPFNKVNSPEELEIQISNESFDLILIDTTGRSQNNIEEIREIKKYFSCISSKFKLHVSLVISSNTKYKDLVEILDKFDILDYTNIIVTKLDETNTVGQVFSAVGSKRRKLSYVTFGQSVPEDIEEANQQKLIDMVLK